MDRRTILFLSFLCTLSLSQTPATAGSSRNGQVRIPFHANLDIPSARALRLLGVMPRIVPGRYAVKFAPGASASARMAVHQAAGARVLHEISPLDIHVVQVSSPRAVGVYRRNPNVRWIEPVMMRYPLITDPDDYAYNTIDYTTPTDPSFATWYKWDAHLIQCVDGWNIWPGHYYTAAGGKGTDGILIAVIDSGVDEGHPDFRNAGGTTTDVSGGGQLDLSLDETIRSGVVTAGAMDDYGHGTHVTGIAAAATNNNATDTTGSSTTGNGINAEVMSVNVIDASGSGTDTDLAQGIVDAANKGALICNISLGGYDYSQAEKDAVDYAWAKGTLTVAAAGNDGDNNQPNYPASLSRVLAVAATSDQDLLATYSNYGDEIGVAAPGGDFDINAGWFIDIWSTMPTYYVTLNDPNVYGASENHDYLEGTSMACPQIVGTAALYAGMQHYTQSTPNLPTLLWQAVQRGADGSGGWNPYYGFGRVNVFGTMNLNTVPNPRGDTVGCIVGQVKYLGTPIANANVVATPTAGGAPESASSRSDGGYRIADAPAGVYNVTATVFGATQTISNVTIVAGADTPGLDFNVAVSGLTQFTVKPVKTPGGCTPAKGTVTLGAAAPAGGTAITVTSNNPSVAVPASNPVTVPAGATSATFPVITYGVTANTSVTLSATDNVTTKLVVVTVTPIGVKSLALTPNPVAGGANVTGKVYLQCAAQPGSITVTLTSSNPSVAHPTVASIVIPQGATYGTFTIATSAVTANTAVTIKASANGTTKSKTLTVYP